MRRRRYVALGLAASVAGCTGSFDSETNSRLDLTVQNERADAITVRVTVVDDEGSTHASEDARIESGVARAFEVAAGRNGRHEATVAGDDWRGQLAWNADTCLRFDGTVRVTAESVEVASECTELR
jgi:hypothetical protein